MYSLYMLEDRLTEHLNTVDDEAQERMDILAVSYTHLIRKEAFYRHAFIKSCQVQVFCSVMYS